MTTTPNFGLNYPLGADAIAVPTDLQNLANDMDTNMATMNARSVSPILIAKNYDPTYVVEVVNTASTTTLISEAISGAQAGEIYELNFFGRYLNNSGASRTFTFTASLGASTLMTGTSAAFAISTVERGFTGSLRLHVDTTSSQLAICDINFTGVGIVANQPFQTMGLLSLQYGSASEDLSTSKNLVLTFAHAAANASLRLRLLGYTLVRLVA